MLTKSFFALPVNEKGFKYPFLDRQGEKAITGIPTEDFDHDTVQNPFSPCLSMKRALTTLSLDRQVKKDITRACQDPPKY